MKRFSKFIIWAMAYVGCMSAIRSVTDSNTIIIILEFLGIISFFIWAFYDEKSKLDEDSSESDMAAIIFTKDDLQRLVEDNAVVMTDDDGLQIYFMSEECYDKSYKNKFAK